MQTTKIERVYFDDTSCDTQTGLNSFLIVFLDNGHEMSIRLNSKANDPAFADILTGRCKSKPQTDGERVFWDNGASLALGEMLNMLQSRHTA